MDGTSSDVCDAIEKDDFFKIFLENQQDAQQKLLTTMTITDQISRLSAGLEQISTHLQSQVRGQYGALLSQANHAGRLNAAIGSISGHIESLQSSAERLKKQVGVPYEQLELQTKILGRLHEASHLLRQSARFLQIFKGLDRASELPDQAAIIYELESLMEDANLVRIECLKEEIATVKSTKARLIQIANRDLFKNIQKEKETETTDCLRIFLNLNILPKCLENILETYERYIKDSLKECFTAADSGGSRKSDSLSKDRSDKTQIKGPGKAPTLTSSTTFRIKLWQSMEWFFVEDLFSHCQQITFLQCCLSRIALNDEPSSKTANSINKLFWKQVEKQLTDSFRNAQPHVQQALQQGLPKLLSLARGLESKTENGFLFDEKVFQTLEAGYLEKCANNLKTVLVNIDFPNQDIIDSIVRVASAELNSAIVDERLTNQVVDVICVSNKDLWNRIERNVKLGGDTQQVLDNPNASQSQNITLANIIRYHHEAINRLLQNLGPKFSTSQSAQKLRESLMDGRTITLAIMQQLVSSIHSAVNIILLSMHREPGLNSSTISTTGPSFYMKELQDFLARSWSSHITPFADKSIIEESSQNLAARCIELFVQNVTIVRPVSNTGRQRLKSDCQHLEVALKPIIPDLSTVGKSFRLLRAISSLLIVTSDELVRQTSGEGGVVPPHIVLFMLFSFAGPELVSPHDTIGWSQEKLIQWLESHTAERDRLELVTGALQKYRTVCRQKNVTRYDVVYPIISNYLEESLKLIDINKA
ncbi:conserved oligomeric Golgi complex subunit 5 [Uranotaenia lowii]|uniref:conserved oligomeric Golgi complex subunit 5 n=1 Tax=Uranotaenia lowii TaxID=190385 RepID=UPI002479B79B|nr:conserved oligomeric Golgi complex subunit 5 [Uranotaenia lowii]